MILINWVKLKPAKCMVVICRILWILLIPILPDKILMQWSSQGTVNWYLSFLIVMFSFIVYELKNYVINNINGFSFEMLLIINKHNNLLY